MFYCTRVKEIGLNIKNYRVISLLSVSGIIYSGILEDEVCRVTGSLIEDEQGVLVWGRSV